MRTKIKKRVKLPISKKYYYSWQMEEYKKVKDRHGKYHADKWFEAKFGR